MKGVIPLLNSRVKCGLEIISMERLGYYNGTYGPLEEMMIPMNDRASWFGDGVYEVTYAINQKPFALDEHIDMQLAHRTKQH